MQKSDKSPNGKYGGKQSLQNIEEQEEENMGSEESVDLSQVEDEYWAETHKPSAKSLK